jgi:hypothetical protein
MTLLLVAISLTRRLIGGAFRLWPFLELKKLELGAGVAQRIESVSGSQTCCMFSVECRACGFGGVGGAVYVFSVELEDHKALPLFLLLGRV